MFNPLISVIIPCHNNANTIEQAIKAILKQTYNNLEIVIIDDWSTDNTYEIIKNFLGEKIRYYRLPTKDRQRINSRGVNINAGYAARNFGMKKAIGELFTFQDADDGCFTNRLQIQYELMQKYNSNHVVVNWQEYSDKLNGTEYKGEIEKVKIIKTDIILKLAKKGQRGLFKIPISFDYGVGVIAKLKRIVANLIDWKWRDWSPYPYAGSMPLFKKEVFNRCHFRQLYERQWPSKKGRGADRDFNFWVATTFKKSISADIPLILWRTKK